LSNPYTKSLDPNFRGQYVRVVSNDGRTLEGWLERMHHQDRHVVLRDAVDVDRDEDLGAAMAAHVDVMAVTDDPSRIERVALDEIEPAPYHAGEFSLAGNRQYVDQVRDRGFVGSFPVVRPIHSGFEIVEGHKRIWACRQAGLDTHPVEIVDVDEWTAARRFVADHLPDERHVHEDGSTANGWYGAEAISTAIDELVGRWGTEALELDRVAFNADRLDLDIGEASTEQDTKDDAGDEVEREDDEAAAEPSEIESDAVSIEDLAEDIAGLGDVGVENLLEAGYETTADLDDATKGDLRAIGQIGAKIANELLLEAADDIFACPECDREFPTSRGRGKHVSDTHGDSDQDGAGDVQDADENSETASITSTCNGGESGSTGDDADDQDDDAGDGRDDSEEIDTGDDIPADQQAFVLEWGRWGPPHSGTYHADEDCFALNRSDSEREAVPLPRSRDELAGDEDWSACGHCTDADDAESEPVDGDEQLDDEDGAGDDVTVDVDGSDQEGDDSAETEALEDADVKPDEIVDELEDDETEQESEEPERDTFPRDCHCGATLQDSLALAIHRTEKHGVPQATLGHLEPGEFEAIVEDAESVKDIVDELGRQPEWVLRVLGLYGLDDVVATDLELSDITDFEFEGIDAGDVDEQLDDDDEDDDEPASASIDAAALTDPLAESGANIDGEDGEAESSVEEPSAAEINAAADEHDYLADVADELGVDSQKARSLLVSHGRYTDVSEASRYRGGVSQ